jgi:hypothetical protein
MSARPGERLDNPVGKRPRGFVGETDTVTAQVITRGRLKDSLFIILQLNVREPLSNVTFSEG